MYHIPIPHVKPFSTKNEKKFLRGEIVRKCGENVGKMWGKCGTGLRPVQP
jgi:hypothetical protein